MFFLRQSLRRALLQVTLVTGINPEHLPPLKEPGEVGRKTIISADHHVFSHHHIFPENKSKQTFPSPGLALSLTPDSLVQS